MSRDLALPAEPSMRGAPGGRMWVVGIGIDRYRAWSCLHNAVTDARGALAAFAALGFEPVRAPILDDAATGAALDRLVKDELTALGVHDSLIVFFAGHGHTVTTTYADGTCSKRGYLIPVDGGATGTGTSSWIHLDSWLSHIAHLPPKHILVILDSCKSGIALSPIVRWRGDGSLSEPLERLRDRRSRRIITSALDDQLAADAGPVAGHSLFTGCLIEALRGGVARQSGDRLMTASEIWLHVQRRVATYPLSTQTPDYGALELHDHGDLIVVLTQDPPQPELPEDPTMASQRQTGPHDIWPKSKSRPDLVRPAAALASEATPTPPTGVAGIMPRRASTAPPGVPPARPVAAHRLPAIPPVAPPVPAPIASPPEPPPAPVASSTPAPIASTPLTAPEPARAAAFANLAPRPVRAQPLDAAFVATLERHDTLRRRGGRVLSMVTADPLTALTGFATWAAGRGWLSLVTAADSLDAAVDDLLRDMPWLRLLPAARARLASAARADVTAIDAEIDRRPGEDRAAWLDEIAGHDVHARVSGWLLAALREPWACVPDLATAPVQGAELLSIAGALAAPIAVVVHHPEPTAPWLDRAIRAAYELAGWLPGHAVAVGAPEELVRHVLGEAPESTALTLARQGMVPLAVRRTPGQARSGVEHTLHAALAADPRTANLFAPNVRVPIHDRERAVEVDLVARDALLAVEIDDWYHVRDPQSYRRDRIKDLWLARAGFFVARFLAEDVEGRLERVIEEITLELGARRASGAFMEPSR
ncbi:MAG TPA: caspase family protein [Kofleriaceae bacterium]|nr:caspase family protein [Kofleriaceae bacterium]